MQGQTAYILAVLLQDLGRQCQSNVNGRSQVSAEGQSFVGESDCVQCITEHYPVIPAKLANLTDVSSPPFHYGFRDLPVCGIDAIGGVRAIQALQFDAVVPKAFWGTSFDHFVGYSLLELVNAALGCLLPGQIWFCHAQVTIHLFQFTPEGSFDLLL
jgi:hypothetical protein